VDFGFDPNLQRNDIIVDLTLAPRNARGEVEATADFFLLKPVDPRRGNGRLFCEVGNRGGKSILATFQKAAASPDPTTQAQFGDGGKVSLDGGFEPGRIYDVVYRAADPRVVGCGLAGTRDIVSFFKNDTSADNPMPGIKYAIGWGVSQSGRFLRHFLYQGFNEDEHGRRVFDGVFDQAGGAGRGSFNHRFGQASRDALQFFNILYPVDLFPFTDGPETDPETDVADSLLGRAARSGTAPKVFHLLTNSEYFNRAGSLVHTDPTGTRDADLPAYTLI